MTRWLAFFRPGDILLILFAFFCVAASFPLFWRSGAGERAVIRVDGEIFREVSLDRATTVVVQGALGETIIEIEKGRARVASDPGLRQYCVRQGWLKSAGAIAICAPNRVSLSIVGRREVYDSLNY
ncbi:MAG: NusG domain II-containing protein [Betaproteobacteria bacterium]|nr:NusG domain II-containing protein [Betaproteobacteria bacterium]